ncbi:MAG: septum formation inhibitor Maf [Rhodocyclaceae bacterium]|jgi:septum formation protein|nr:septum formation inhibitor Maf [Rhodocyclaceae bacterium]MBK6553273.1 septum formation inhibitor Maf [Rhodocyclaceae bacterium]MBK6675828.1 septum formation inhibitor Maf [Rhodocyclaceae bacterium]MBK9311710.1 septum formation inhibitor Maf [Rhodocyclaceae bacterium]MBK9956935.1 septum formation inhibitor Maf [Rhodocyclaceae bacterium]
MPTIVLASTSPFRRELLGRLGLPFEAVAPDVDESSLVGESPVATAERLSVAKARAVTHRHPEALIIGSDQVAYLGESRFGKPATRQNAIAQLRAMSGKAVIFHTGLCLLNAATGRLHLRGVPTEVRFRELADAEILRYQDKENALNCAGSARSEGLGISLLEYMRGDDPNALVGLPLIALCEMLRAEGVQLP